MADSAKASKSTLMKVLDGFSWLPEKQRASAFSLVFGTVVKFFGTSSLKFEVVSPERSIVLIRNRRKIQNHIGGVHAVAMALIAESATGSIVGLNLGSESIPVIKSMTVNYLKRSKGDMRAEAWLTPEQIEQIKTTPKGEVEVACKVTDEDGKEPISVSMIWAWTPVRR